MAVAVAMRTGWPARQPSPKKSSAPRMRNDRFFALFGDDCELDLAVLDIKDGVGRVTLRK